MKFNSHESFLFVCMSGVTLVKVQHNISKDVGIKEYDALFIVRETHIIMHENDKNVVSEKNIESAFFFSLKLLFCYDYVKMCRSNSFFSVLLRDFTTFILLCM